MPPYVPNATDTTQPTGDKKVASAPPEFRTLKTYLQTVVDDFQDQLDSLVNSIGAGDSSVALAANLINTADVLKGAALLKANFALNYTVGTIGKVIRDREWCITDFPWGAVGDDATDNYAAILAAQTALSAAGGGTLIIPKGTFRYLTAIPRVNNVDYRGLGWSSILKPVGCSAFTYAFVTGFGRSATHNMWIQGLNGTAQIGIYQPGTLNDADELYGLSIEGCAITGFNTAIQFRTLRNFSIQNNWIQDVNSGIKLIGKCLRGNVHNNEIVKAAGSGVGTSYGILLNSFNYTSGAGIVPPEGVHMDNPYVQGFEYCIDIAAGLEIRCNNVDIAGTIIPLRFSSVVSLSVLGGYIQGIGASLQFGVHGPAQGASNNSKYVLRALNINAISAPAGASGIMLGTRAVGGNQDGVTVEDCEFSGWTAYDIEQYASGNNRILGNRCGSSGTTQSMSIVACSTGKPTYVRDNQCAKAITYDAADFNSNLLQLGTNVINGATINYGLGDPTTPAYAAGNFTANGTMTWTVDAGDVSTFTYSFSGKMMTVVYSINTTTVAGALNNQLRITIPGGRVAAKAAVNPCLLLDNLVRSIAYASVSAAGTTIGITRADAANFTASVNQTFVQGSITFEIQ